MTEHERTQWYKLAYMWAGLNKNFYNPFDKVKILFQ